MKETFIIRTEWSKSIKVLSDEDKGKLLMNLFYYHQGQPESIDLSSTHLQLVWGFIEPNLIRNIESYDKRSVTSKENGAKGGRPIEKNNLNKPNSEIGINLNNLTEPNETLSVSVSDSVLVSDSDSDSDIVIETDIKKEKTDFLQNRPRSKKVDVEFSEESNQFVSWWIKNYSQPHIKVSDQMISDWRKVWDKLRAEYEKEVLKAVIDFTMKDEFWAKNLQTPLKLSKKNKDGIRYIDQFITNYRIKNRAAIIDQQTDWNGFVNDIIKQNA